MRTIFVKRAFDHRVSHSFLISYSPGSNVEVDEEAAAYAVARGHAEYSDFAEERLFDRSHEEAEDEAIRAIVQTAHDQAVEDAEEGE